MNELQEVFTTVSKHLLAQGVACRNEDDDCMYRNEEGLKCAVGCLISDEAYREHQYDIENTGVDEPEVLKAL